MAGAALLLLALLTNRRTSSEQALTPPDTGSASDITATKEAPGANGEPAPALSLTMLDHLAPEMISPGDQATPHPETASHPSPKEMNISTSASISAENRINHAVQPYINPDVMISPPPITPQQTPDELTKPPAGFMASASELIAQAYINKTLMVSEPPEDFSQAWITYHDHAERRQSAAADEGKIPAAQIGPANPEDITRAMFFVREAEGQRREGNIDEAIRFYQQALERFPRMSLANREVGRLFLMKGKYNDAITHLSAALSGNEQLGAIYCDLGSAYLYSDQPAQALESFIDGMKAEPGNTELQFNQGLALRRLNRLDESQLVLESYIDTNPGDARAFRELAIVHLAETNITTALPLLEKAVELDPDWYTPMMDLALIRAKQGNPLEALHYLEMMIGKTPAWLLARIYQQPAFAGLRLMPESREFEARLADQYRQGK